MGRGRPSRPLRLTAARPTGTTQPECRQRGTARPSHRYSLASVRLQGPPPPLGLEYADMHATFVRPPVRAVATTLLQSRVMLISKRSLTVIAAVLAAAVIAAVGFSLGRASRSDTATPTIRQGTVAMVSIDGSEFAVVPDGASTANSYPMPSVWIDAQGTNHDGDHPACLQPLSKGQHITYAVVQVDPVQGAVGAVLAAWVKCD
jgi:hypothetical protein